MSALEQEIIDMFDLLDKAAQQRVLARMKQYLLDEKTAQSQPAEEKLDDLTPKPPAQP